jgi:DNA-binding MarR family transcriptional regulator
MASKRKREIDYRALAEFRFEIRQFLNFSERAARRVGIEPHQHQALLVIKGSPLGRNVTVGALAERLQIQHHSAVELANRLQGKGLISRRRGHADRREVLLSLTAHGERLLKVLTLPHRDELRTAAPKLLRALRATAGSASGSRQAKSRPARAQETKKKKQRSRTNENLTALNQDSPEAS